MIHTKTNKQAGFTIIELLVTLFVAAAFLTAGFMLYIYVLRDGGQARAATNASNVAYDYMRRYAGTAQSPCVQPSPQPLINSPITVSSLTNVTVSVSITCPSTVTPSLSRIDVTVLYNNPQQTMKYTTYVSL
jgi:prepilin-type N-terminal cleavage/methylation domain-containing protein